MEPTTTAAATVLNPITAGLLVGGSAYAGYKGAEYLHQRFSKSASAGLESVKQKSEMQQLIEALKPKAPEPSKEGLLASLIASLMGKVQEPTPAPVPAPSKEEAQMAALMELLSTTTAAAPKGELSEVEAKLAAAAKKK